MNAVCRELQAQQLNVLFGVDASLTALPDEHHGEQREGQAVKEQPQRLRDGFRQLRFLKGRIDMRTCAQ